MYLANKYLVSQNLIIQQSPIITPIAVHLTLPRFLDKVFQHPFVRSWIMLFIECEI
jgi:hypothetical protein